MAYDVEKTWVTKSGFTAVCIAIKEMHRCGYVGVPQEHPLHGIKYNQSTELLKSHWENIMNGGEDTENKRGAIITLLASCNPDGPENWSPDRILNVHGGLTYSGGKDYPIENKENLWWFGFDCGHCDDGCFDGKMKQFTNAPVRTMEYVMSECESLATQISILTPN